MVKSNYGSVDPEDPYEKAMERSRHVTFSDSISKGIQSIVASSLILGGQNHSLQAHVGTTPMTKQIFNLTKNIVGCGVLALPSGVAAFADAPSAVLPATFFTLLMAAVFGHYFLLIGKICGMRWAVTFREAWNDTVGEKGSHWVVLCNMLAPALANLSYSMILADTFRDLFATVGMDWSRTNSLLIVTIVALLPLCMLKNLDMLAPFSVVGTIVFVFVAVVMGVRYADGTYDEDRSGIYLQDLANHHKPAFGTTGMSGAWSYKVLLLICMLFQAYVAHYNAPRFWVELKDHTVPRFRIVTASSFGASSVLFIFITAFGFLTFGANCDGYILNNYSTKDSLATACRVGIAIAILFTYPLAFIGYRDGVLDLCQVPPNKHTGGNLNLITVVLLSIVTVIAIFVKDLGLINAIGGGTLTTAIVFIFPSLMYQQAVKAKPLDVLEDDEVERPTPAQKREVRLTLGLMWIGIALGVVGVVIALTG